MASPEGADSVLWPDKGARIPYGGIPGENELIARAKSGDSIALDQICSAHWTGVHTLIASSVRAPADAEELTQEVFERAIRSLPNFEYTGAPFSAYLTRIARNLIHDTWRMQSRRSVHQSEWPNFEIADAETPEDQAVSTSELEVLRIAMKKLSLNHRRVLYLRLVEGLSTEETARRMGRGNDAIRQLQKRALDALRREANRIGRR